MKNPFKFNLVQFSDGTYGVRRGLFSHEYLDTDMRHTWHSPYAVNVYCKGTLEEMKELQQRAALDSKLL